MTGDGVCRAPSPAVIGWRAGKDSTPRPSDPKSHAREHQLRPGPGLSSESANDAKSIRFCQNSDNDVQSGAIWGSETAFAESDGGPLDD